MSAPQAHPRRTAIIVTLIAGALPMVAYPMLLTASAMQMFGNLSGIRGWHDLARWYFLAGGLLYPVLYVIAFMASWLAYRRGDSRRALKASLLPLVFLLTLVACLAALLQFPASPA